MSAIGNAVIGMQEDAIEMPKKDFIAEHGEDAIGIWEVQNGEMEHPGFDEYQESEAGFYD